MSWLWVDLTRFCEWVWIFLQIWPHMTCENWKDISAMRSLSWLSLLLAWRIQNLISRSETSVSKFLFDGKAITLRSIGVSIGGAWFMYSSYLSNSVSLSKIGFSFSEFSITPATVWRSFSCANMATKAARFSSMTSCSESWTSSDNIL